MRRATLALLLLCTACGEEDDYLILDPPAAGPAGGAAGSAGGEGSGLSLPAACAADGEVPPRSLACTGLYADIASGTTSAEARAFLPAVELWSDGAEKRRWIYLPAGSVIDNTDPDEWVFPVGTRAWKEFSRAGRRIETRLWQKVREGYWVKATYAWNEEQTAAEQAPGGDIVLPDGSRYHVPTADECQQCHRGRKEHLLGFEQVLLGLPGAAGVTLADLAGAGTMRAPLSASRVTLPDDGTGAAGAPLGWLHANCGVSCHNGNPNAVAYAAGMRLRLRPAQLDGRSALELDTLTTTLALPARAPAWRGAPRIVAGDPAGSLLYRLLSTRGVANQMPPIATAVTDDVNAALIAAWIERMPAGSPPAPDGDPPGPDAGVDAGGDLPGPEMAETDAGAPDGPDPAFPDAPDGQDGLGLGVD